MFFHVQRKLPLCLKRLKAKKQFSQRIDHTGKKTPDLLPDLESKVQIVPLLVSLKNSVL